MDWRQVESTRPPAPRVAASEVRPSIRDFTQYLGTGRAALAVIPLLARHTPLGAHSSSTDTAGDHAASLGAASPSGDVPGGNGALAALAAELDALEIPALAVATAPGAGALDDLVAVARAASAPVLRYDCVADENRLYESRLAGADAVLVPAALAGTSLPRLVSLARAIHVVCVVEVATAADSAAASAAAAPVVALAPGALALASTISPRHPLVAQEPIASAADLARLRGVVDAVLVATGGGAEGAQRIAALVEAAETEPGS